MVVGGGVAGLVTALDCAKLGLRVVVLERADEPGGCVGRIELDGLVLDSGAESFATRGGAVAELLDELGLADDIVSPNPGGAWLATPAGADGVRAVPMPKTGMLGIPANPLGDDVRAVIGWRGAWRAYADRVMPILRIGRARSVGALVRTRMGRAVLDRLVTPISSGVYSTDPDDLDLDVVAPGLNGAMTRAGSLSGGVALLVEQRTAGAAVQGIRGGMHRLVDALMRDLARFDVTVVTGADVTALTSVALDTDRADAAAPAPSATWIVHARTEAGPLIVDAGQVVLAASASVSQRLLSQISGEVAPAEPEVHAAGADADAGAGADAPTEVPSTPTDVASAETYVELVHLVLDAPELAEAPRGTGVLVAADATAVGAKALTHSTAKWGWLAEALVSSRGGSSRQVLRLSYGRIGRPNPLTALSNDEVRALAVRDASRLLGVPLDRSHVRALGRVIWRDARSRASLSRSPEIDAIVERVDETSDLEATGAWVAGTGLASVVPHAREVAHRVRARAMQRGDIG